MPSPIEDLKRDLGANLRILVAERWMLPSAAVDGMHRTVERLRKEIGERPPQPPKDRICGALAALRSRGAASLDGAQFYFACWGLTEACGTHGPLIEDRRHFPDMLNEIRQRRPLTLPWRGLLDAYFRYTPQPGSDGERHWKMLRDWLAKDLLHALHARLPPALRELPWLKVLQSNYVLFEDRPCRSYAASALQGDSTRIANLESALDITPTSWFWRELVYSQIEEAVGWREDARFKQVLDALLKQLAEHPVVMDMGLAMLLNRYADCADTSVHEDLKQRSVKSWGSPQLVQQAKWGLVEPRVKEMVSQWLVLEDLEDFFERLQASGQADRRRLTFWKRFIKQISFSHVALSRHLWFSRQPNWLEFRHKKGGRISRLDGGGGGKNAFIMKIGDYYFVEFGETGDACYGYTVGSEPFSLGSGLLNYPYDLKDKKRRVFWGSHIDGIKPWERKFMDGTDKWPGLSDLGLRP